MNAKQIYDFLEDLNPEELAKALFMRETESDLTSKELQEIYDYYEEEDGLTLISQDIIDKIIEIERRAI